MSTETLTNHNTTHAEHGHHDAGANKVFGFWVYLMSDLIIFGSLFATYAVLVNGTAGTKREGTFPTAFRAGGNVRAVVQ